MDTSSFVFSSTMRQSLTAIPADFLDVFTHEPIMADPVRAMDGNTYSRKNIEKYFKECMDRVGYYYSPLTHEVIDSNLVTDDAMTERIKEFKNSHTAHADTLSLCSSNVSSIQDQSCISIASILDLNHIYSRLDALRPTLNKALDKKNWLPPNFSVVGGENAGKSTLLERIGLISLLPRHEDICTRVPILVQLRHSEKRTAPTLEVIDLATSQPIQPSYIISIDAGHIDVRKEMEAIVKKHNGKLEGVVEDKIIVLTVESPDVPSLNLMDLPGLVMTANSSQPADMSMRAQNIIKNLVTKHGEHTLYLVVIPGQVALNMDIGLKVIMDNKISHRALGVITKCDEIPNKARPAANVIRDRTNGIGCNHIDLVPHGYVCVANPVTIAGPGESNLHAMKRQAQAEYDTFLEFGLKDMWDDNKLGTTALIDRMNSMFLDYMRKTWIGYMIDLLREEEQLVTHQNRELGLPASHRSMHDESSDSDPVDPSIRGSSSAKNLVQSAIAAFDAIKKSFLITIDARVKNDIMIPLQQSLMDVMLVASAAELTSCGDLQDHLDALKSTLHEVAETRFRSLKLLWLDEYCSSLCDDSSLFKLGRFSTTIGQIKKHLQELFQPLEDRFALRIKECIDHHTSIPSSSTVHFKYCASGSVELRIDVDDIIGHICHVTVGECYSDLRKIYTALSFENYAQSLEVENCVEERIGLEAKMKHIEDAMRHMMSFALDVSVSNDAISSSLSLSSSSCSASVVSGLLTEGQGSLTNQVQETTHAPEATLDGSYYEMLSPLDDSTRQATGTSSVTGDSQSRLQQAGGKTVPPAAVGRLDPNAATFSPSFQSAVLSQPPENVDKAVIFVKEGDNGNEVEKKSPNKKTKKKGK